jgi:dolichol-phosphate mannosyltransferase
MISVVSPIYNEAENVRELVARVTAALEQTGEDFEYVLVDNGCTDGSLRIIKSLARQDARVKYLSLSRNFGPQGAILAGMSRARGDAVISLDGDLQHPPELIAEMVEAWKQGYDVVHTTKQPGSYQNGLRCWLTRCFYRLISLVSDVKLAYGQSDFRLLSRQVVDVLLNIPEKGQFLRGLVEWVGFKTTSVEYRPDFRKRGHSKFSIWGYLSFAVDGIVSFSVVPLRMFLYCGLGISLLCVGYAAYLFAVGLLNLTGWAEYDIPPGWVTITISILFLNSVQLIGIGVLGEYLGRVFKQTKSRPEFIIREDGTRPAKTAPEPDGTGDAPHTEDNDVPMVGAK